MSASLLDSLKDFCKIHLLLLLPDRCQASLVAQTEKNLPAMWETWVQSLGQEDPLEKEVATHSCSCLDNPMDRARQATVPGGPKSQTELSDYTFTFTWKYRKFQSISS